MASDPLDLFVGTARTHADLIAVQESNRSVRYTDLLISARNLGEYAKRHGVKRVALLLPAGADAYAAMFGTLMAAAQYCPINVDIPSEKIEKILSSFQPDLVLTDGRNVSLENRYPCLATKQIPEVLSGLETELKSGESDGIAYTIFTSGTTGQPKGVQVSRNALANYLAWVRSAFPLDPAVRWSQYPNIGFDLSVLDIYGALCHGATLYPLQGAFARMFPARFIQKHQLQIWNSTPSVLDLILQDANADSSALASLQLINVCGEPLQTRTLEQLFKRWPHLQVQNTYGPTEATVSCTEILLTRDNYQKFCRHSACFGRMIDGMQCYLDSETGVEDATRGELYLYGEQLAEGYLGRSDLTEEKFVNLRIDGEMRRCYKTGDIVELRDGQLYFVSRVDELVKVGGKQIDLAAIEATISKLIALECCLVYSDAELCLVVKGEWSGGIVELRKRLLASLEVHELPARVFTVTAFPRSNNDKIDKKALVKQVRVHAA